VRLGDLAPNIRFTPGFLRGYASTANGVGMPTCAVACEAVLSNLPIKRLKRTTHIGAESARRLQKILRNKNQLKRRRIL
jgi:hypothetical protein